MPNSFENLDNIKSLSEKISAVFSQNEVLRLAINTSHEGIAILNDKGEYVYMNDAHAIMFGYDSGELIGKTWEVLYKQSDIDYFKETVFPIIGKEGKWNGKYVAYTKQGKPVNEEVYLTSLPNGGLVCTCRIIKN